MADKTYHVIVIGGGAAGMAAAVAALQEMGNSNGGKNAGKVLLLESNDRVGKKILATGNGKCNFTHENISIKHYNTDDENLLESVLSGFPTEAALQFFEEMGMFSKEKNGYFYPFSETASTVLDVLRLRLSELGCETLCSIRVERIEKSVPGFFVSFREQEKHYRVYADSVILATGSRAGGFLQDKEEDPLRLPKSLGMRSTPLYPALTKCVCREQYYYKQLAGVRAQTELFLYAEKDVRNKTGNMDKSYTERESQNPALGKCEKSEENIKNNWELLRQEKGELQLTKEGISGIPVFQLSGTIAQKLAEKKRVIIEINFLPEFKENELEVWAKKRISLLPGRTLDEFFLGVLHKKILGVCLQAEGLRGNMRVPCADDNGNIENMDKEQNDLPENIGSLSAEKRALIMITSVMKRAMHFTTEVTAVSDMKQAQVCRGGLCLSQFSENLECKSLPGLFACGEVLNVDGECGGYNLHFAWASGVLTGREAIRRNSVYG